MENGASASNRDTPEVSERWSARKAQPIVVLYLAGVSAACVAAAHFVFHSPEAVKALVVAAVSAMGAAVPGVIEKIEYQLTGTGIEKRKANPKKPGQFENVFAWSELSHVVPVKHGFKYVKTINETNALRRFWKRHISDKFSGEVHVERNQRDRILGIVERQRSAAPAAD